MSLFKMAALENIFSHDAQVVKTWIKLEFNLLWKLSAKMSNYVVKTWIKL
jgi:hypothetical protein